LYYTQFSQARAYKKKRIKKHTLIFFNGRNSEERDCRIISNFCKFSVFNMVHKISIRLIDCNIVTVNMR
jgi:hypothetical protein